MIDEYRINSFHLKKTYLGIGLTQMQSVYYILINDKLFWERYKKTMHFYKHRKELTIEPNFFYERYFYDISTEVKIYEECPDNLTIDEYLKCTGEIKIIIAKIKSLQTSDDNVEVNFERFDGQYKYPVNDPSYYYYTIKLSEALIAEEEILVVVDTQSNYLLSVKYEFDKLEINKKDIKERIIPKQLGGVKNVSSVPLSEDIILCKINDYLKKKNTDIIKFTLTILGEIYGQRESDSIAIINRVFDLFQFPKPYIKDAWLIFQFSNDNYQYINIRNERINKINKLKKRKFDLSKLVLSSNSEAKNNQFLKKIEAINKSIMDNSDLILNPNTSKLALNTIYLADKFAIIFKKLNMPVKDLNEIEFSNLKSAIRQFYDGRLNNNLIHQ